MIYRQTSGWTVRNKCDFIYDTDIIKWVFSWIIIILDIDGERLYDNI